MYSGMPLADNATRHDTRCVAGSAPYAVPAPGQVDHWICCADVALWVERRWGRDTVSSERELRYAEREAGMFGCFTHGAERTDQLAPPSVDCLIIPS